MVGVWGAYCRMGARRHWHRADARRTSYGGSSECHWERMATLNRMRKTRAKRRVSSATGSLRRLLPMRYLRRHLAMGKGLIGHAVLEEYSQLEILMDRGQRLSR